MNIVLRHPFESDRLAWKDMVLDYDPDLTPELNVAWKKIMDGRTKCLLATFDNVPVGFMHHVFHDFPLMDGKVCYMADLYVTPEFRRNGIARQFIDSLMVAAVWEKWRRVYWVTEHGNPARVLYDRYAEPDFVRYHADISQLLLNATRRRTAC
jgi:GNAT superfamily N-acetyltransferase